VRSPNIIEPRHRTDTFSPFSPSLLYSIACTFDHFQGEIMIHVIAIITAKPGQRGKVLEAARANLAVVRAEDGCVEYEPTIDVEGFGGAQTPLGADTFVFIEKWRDADALKAHARAPHMAAYAAKVKDMVASRVIHVLSSAA
jgi:quinol monooxygenase YgiN